MNKGKVSNITSFQSKKTAFACVYSSQCLYRYNPRSILHECGFSARQGLSRDVMLQASIGGSNGGNGSSNVSVSNGDGNQDGSKDSKAHPMQLWTYLFAGFLTVGGLMALKTKGSKQSFTASLSSAFILALCGRSMMGPTAVGAARVALGLSFLLAVFMGNRFANSKKVMPSGLVAAVASAMSAGYLLSPSS